MPKQLHYILNFTTYFMEDYSTFRVAFWVLFGLMVVTLALLGYIETNFRRGIFKQLWPLVALRYLSNILATAALMPGLNDADFMAYG